LCVFLVLCDFFFPVTVFPSHWKHFHLLFALGLGASPGPPRCCFCYQLEYKSAAIYQRYIEGNTQAALQRGVRLQAQLWLPLRCIVHRF
jgi:hypothetical protein